MAQIVKLITKNNVSAALHLAMMLQKRYEDNPDAADVELVLREPKRNNDQNALFHALCEQMAEKAKYCSKLNDKFLNTAEWWKDEFKCKLGKKEVHFDIEENPTVMVVSTTKYSKPEMALFVDKIIAFADTQYGISLEIKDA